MRHDIDAVLAAWPRQGNGVQTRLISAADGRKLIQIRIDLGILQLETTDRPDGVRPHGFATYFDYLKDAAAEADGEFVLDEEQSGEADREFVQYYHRRVGWLSLRQFDSVVADADHTLAFMDFIRDHSSSEEYALAHEPYRGFVIFQRTQAAAAAAIERNKPEVAIDEIRASIEALGRLRGEEDAEDDGLALTLQGMEKSLREMHGIDATLREQLERAVANEEYEAAARLRDALRRQA